MLTKFKKLVRSTIDEVSAPASEALTEKIERDLATARAELTQAEQRHGEVVADSLAGGHHPSADAEDEYAAKAKRVWELEMALDATQRRSRVQAASKQTAAAAAKLEVDRAALDRLKAAGSEFDACLVSLERVGDQLASAMAAAEGIGNTEVHYRLMDSGLRLPTILAARLKKFPSVKQAPPNLDTSQITKWLPGPELLKKGVRHE